jgi:hypothetical protein
LELDEVNEDDGSVGGGDVGVHVEVGAEKRGAMLAEDDDGDGDEKEEKDKVHANIF